MSDERLKTWLGFWKWLISTVVVTGGVGLATTIINADLQKNRLEIERAEKEANVKTTIIKQEREYLTSFLDRALDDNLDKRFRFAQYFAAVSHSDEYKKGWREYFSQILAERKKVEERTIALRAELQNKTGIELEMAVLELVQLSSDLAGPVVRHGPAYDEFIDTSLAALNRSIAAFIASIPADGYPQTSFDNHQQFYADTLGQIQALQTRAAARPVPGYATVQLPGFGEPAANVVGVGDQLPTIESLDIVADRITKMRDRHGSADGLSQTYAQRIGEQIQIALRNAITYELALRPSRPLLRD